MAGNSEGGRQVDVRAGSPLAAVVELARPGWQCQTGFGVAFFCFGGAVGELTGLSVTHGLTQALLTSVFGFVGGVLLTFAGFRRMTEDGRTRLEPAPFLASIVGLSLGLSLAGPTGMYLRCNVQVEEWFLGQKLPSSLCVQGIATHRSSPNDKHATETRVDAISRSAESADGKAVSDAATPMALNNGFGLQQGKHDSCRQELKTLSVAFDESGQDAYALRSLLSKVIKACKLGTE
jgi:hypothetical protein